MGYFAAERSVFVCGIAKQRRNKENIDNRQE